MVMEWQKCLIVSGFNIFLDNSDILYTIKKKSMKQKKNHHISDFRKEVIDIQKVQKSKTTFIYFM